MTAVLVAAEKLRDAAGDSAAAFDHNVAALGAWAAEEDGAAIRDSGNSITSLLGPATAAGRALEADIESFVQTFSNIMTLENDLDKAEREVARLQKIADKADRHLQKVTQSNGDTFQAEIDARATKEAVNAATEGRDAKLKARDKGRELNFNKG